jgi:hypothetical protein
VADRWAWVLRTALGEALPGSQRARGRRLVYTRNRAAEARLTLSLGDTAAIALFTELRNAIPTLTVYRNGDLVFGGHMRPISGGNAAGENSHVELVFKDAFVLLDDRITDEAPLATDAGQIAANLITVSNSDYGEILPITIGTIEATKIRDRTYFSKVISEAIIELTEVEGGFDWYPTYLDPVGMAFNVAASYGSDRDDAIFEFGTGTLANCHGYDFTLSLPVNAVRAIGSAAHIDEFDEDSMGRFGVFQQTVSATDVAENAVLTDKALDALRPEPVLVTAIHPDPARAPQPWDRFWVGDTVRWNVDDGAIQQQLAPRVQTIEIGLDDSDNIDDLVVGIDPGAKGGFLVPAQSTRAYVTAQREILRRLSALER